MMLTEDPRLTAFLISAIVVYIIGVFFKVYDLRAHVIYESFRCYGELKTKHLWIGLIWPLLVVKQLLLFCIWFLNKAILVLLLFIGFKYEGTKLYKKVELYIIQKS